MNSSTRNNQKNPVWAIISYFFMGLVVLAVHFYYLYFDPNFYIRYSGLKIGYPFLGSTFILIAIGAMIIRLKERNENK